MDTYSQALKNYHENKDPDYYEIIRDDGYSSTVPLAVFFDDSSFSEIELLALENSKGKILDVGAGAGRHSLELQRRKANITAIDISQEAVNIMKNRGIKKVIHSDIMELSGFKFDTLLMLMNSMGMVGGPEKLDEFFIKAKELLTQNGIIVFDSIDVSKTDTPQHVNYRDNNILNNNYPGQQKLKINYAGTVGKWFSWLHVSFAEVAQFAEKHGFSSKLLKEKSNGQYVALLQIKS